MKNLKLLLITVFSLTLFFGFFSTEHAFADTFTLSGSVKDTSGNGISGTTVSVNDANSDNTTTDSSGNYSFSIPSGTYNVQATLPSGSSFTSAVVVNQNINANTVINFVLVPSGTVTLSGHVLDRANQPLANQTVGIAPSGTNNYTFTTSDSNGSYSFSTTPGSYKIQVSGSTPLTVDAPPSYSVISSGTLALTQSIIMDIPLPAKQVVVHVQDANSVAQANVGIATNAPSLPNIPIGTVTNATGISSYSTSLGLKTDSSGNVTLWLFPTPTSGNRYTITATPPSGSSFVTTNLSSVAVFNDTQITLAMATPVTLSGRVLDGNSQPIANQSVGIAPSGTNNFVFSTSNSGGNYSFSVAPGSYKLQIFGTNPLTVNAPPNYSSLSSGTLSLTQNTTMDIPLPINQVSLHVQDVNGSSQANVGISTNAPSLSAPIGTVSNASGTDGYGTSVGLKTDSSGNATLWLYQTPVSGNRYTITATPPSGSSVVTTSLSGVAVNGATQLTLTMTTPVTLSGHVLDRANHPLANQTVAIAPSGTSNFVNSVTDSNGNYSFTVTPGNYLIQVSGSNPLTVNAPPSYSIQSSGTLALIQNTAMDIPIPAKQVVVHVQDANGTAQANIGIVTNVPSLPNIPIGTVTNSTGISSYNSSLGLKTDISGNVSLWLFSTPTSGNRYTITATPPNGSIFNTFSLSNVSVTQDETELVSLQYNHAAPTTTSILSPTPDNQGNYSNPTTVTLSAIAASGYTVANTYYVVDGASQQPYSSPFTVSGNGSHTITYWSVDNSGVPELPNNKTFTILATYNLTGTVYKDANQNGVQDTGEQGFASTSVMLNSGQTATTSSNGTYTFANLQPGTYTETLTLPNGYTATTTNPATISLTADTTQNFGISSTPSLVLGINAGGNTASSFAADTDFAGGQTYTSSANVDTSGVTNPAPQVVYQSVRYGNFTYTFPNLTPNANYTVRLHFNELYWGTGGDDATGKRVFNVSVNGTQALTNYDIYQQAGGANKAIEEQIPATADANGNIAISFSTVTDNAMVNGIELYSGTLPSPSPTPTPTPVTSETINSGGSTSGSYVADAHYFGGTPFTSIASVDTSGVTNPAPESVYQSVRYGNFSYTIPTYSASTSYHVRLHFNELYWGTDGSDGTGKRVFNITINGTQVLNNFDIYQTAGGANKAFVEDFDTTTDANGRIYIQFNTVTDNAMVNGIEVSKN